MKHLLRSEIVTVAQAMSQSGLTQGTSGNVSARVAGGLLITPSGAPYETMRPTDVVELRTDGSPVGPARQPSSEWRMHRDIYEARPEVEAIVHTHSMFATTLACLRYDIPAIHYMIAVAGGSTIRCAPYATFGTAELAAHAVAALRGRKACLLANHGMLALGATLGDALRIAREVENLAAQYWRALQVGQPYVLDDAEMEKVIEKFRGYGPGGRATPDRPLLPYRPDRAASGWPRRSG